MVKKVIKQEAAADDQPIIETDQKGRTLMHIAAMKGDYNAVRELLIKRAPIDIHDNEGMTPLHLAAMRDHYRVVDLLLQWGAAVNAKNHLGFTPLRLLFISFEEKNDTAQVLRMYGGKIWKKR